MSNTSSGFNFEQNNDCLSFTSKLVAQIVNEQDEYTMNMIEEYVKNEQAKGNCIGVRIIPEGKLKHVMNLGLTIFNKEVNGDLLETELFSEQEYVEFLRREIHRYQEENLLEKEKTMNEEF